MSTDLPFIDEFDAMVEATPPRVFVATARVIGRSFDGRRARVLSSFLGCVNRGTSYRVPPVEGQEGPGFRVAKVNEPNELVLEGQHRFAAYRLSFFVDSAAEGRSQLRARTDALFPGVKGAAYRALVIGTGAHEIVVRRILAAIAGQAERSPGLR